METQRSLDKPALSRPNPVSGDLDLDESDLTGFPPGEYIKEAAQLPAICRAQPLEVTGHYDTAKRNLAEAVNIYVELGYRRREADTYYELAENAGSSGDNAMALVHRERADKIYSELRLTPTRP